MFAAGHPCASRPQAGCSQAQDCPQPVPASPSRGHQVHPFLVRHLDFFRPCLGFLSAVPWAGSHHIPGKGFSCCRVTSPRESLCSAENPSETFRNLGLLPLPEDPGEFHSPEGALPAGFPWEGFVRDVLVPPFHVLGSGSGGELGWGSHST